MPFRDESSLLPETVLGAQVRGGFPVGATKFNYSLYVANGPKLVTDPANGNPGTLQFDNFDDFKHNKSVGGRIGFLPISALELGYGWQAARMDATGTSSAHTKAFLQSVDLNYVSDIEQIKGIIAVRGQWLWSSVDKVTYDPTGANGIGPLDFNNDRNGGYVQVSYRPSKLDMPFANNLEPILRYDRLHQPSAAPGARLPAVAPIASPPRAVRREILPVIGTVLARS